MEEMKTVLITFTLFFFGCSMQKDKLFMNLSSEYVSEDNSVSLLLYNDSIYFYIQDNSKFSYGVWNLDMDNRVYLKYQFKQYDNKRDPNQVNSMFLLFEKTKLAPINDNSIFITYDNGNTIKLVKSNSISDSMENMIDLYGDISE
jgi:hypothetical protein